MKRYVIYSSMGLDSSRQVDFIIDNNTNKLQIINDMLNGFQTSIDYNHTKACETEQLVNYHFPIGINKYQN